MLKKFAAISLVLASAWAVNGVAAVPAPFQGHDPDSAFTVNYGDVDAILKTMVVDVGRSTREVSAPSQSKTGTRMKAKVSRTTSKEGNRFYFEEFEDNEEYQRALGNIRTALEGIPGRMPLEYFSRNEQLAYWLNLYNITLLDELVQIYPERDVKREIIGRKSILDEKTLNVAGVPLSLNDIQYTILAENYDNDPLIMYGLFQGAIGGPNIRKRAYTGENVRRYLQDNAEEFVNSNRGTYSRNSDFEVSTLYERNSRYFPNFDRDLKQHLLQYIEGQERIDLQAADKLDPDIDDWTIADVYGSYQEIGGSFADSSAALMDAVISTQPDGEGGTIVTNASASYSSLVAKAEPVSVISPEQLDMLHSIKAREEAANLMKEGRVTVEELGTFPVDDDTEGDNE